MLSQFEVNSWSLPKSKFDDKLIISCVHMNITFWGHYQKLRNSRWRRPDLIPYANYSPCIMCDALLKFIVAIYYRYEIFAIHLRKFGIKCRRRNAIWCYIIICLYENMILFKNLHTFSFIASGARLYSAKAHRRNRMNSCKFRVKVIIFTTPHPAHGYWKRDSFMQMKNPKIPPKNIWFDFVVAFVRN